LKGWIDLENHCDSSGKSLEKLASEVLERYGIVPESMAVIQSGAIKTVWKFKANGRLLCLKRLRQTLDKALFSANAQIHIRKSGGLVPGILPDKNGQPVVQYGDQLFVLYEWINGTDLNFGNPADLKQAVQGLARFHIASKGYQPGEEARVSSKLGKWPEQYASMKNKLALWKETALGGLSQPAYASYARCVDPMLRLADQAIDLLGRSEYGVLTGKGSGSVVLCHQDYGKGNAIAAGNGVYVLDLDGVTFDLPARDLRKIIGKIAENKGQWQAGSIRDIMAWYTEIHPQNEEERAALYTDLLFPHWFYGLVKNLFQGAKPLKAAEIERIAKLEEAKVPVLKTFQK
jgi:spore coat protein I